MGDGHNDRAHGLRFNAHQLKPVPSSTIEGIEKHLSSGMVRGVGPHFAKVLVRAFRENVLTVIEREPQEWVASQEEEWLRHRYIHIERGWNLATRHGPSP